MYMGLHAQRWILVGRLCLRPVLWGFLLRRSSSHGAAACRCGKNGKSVWTLWVGAFCGWAIAFAHDGAQYISQLSVSCICAHHAQFFQIPEISWNTENQHIRPWPSQLLFGDLWKTTSDRRKQCTCEGSLNYSLLDPTICGPPILEQFPNTERLPIVSFYRFQSL